MGAFRIIVGSICAVLAVAIMVLNIALLSRYGYQSSDDTIERIINAGIASIIPIGISLMPILVALGWRGGIWFYSERKKRMVWRRGRPSPVGLIIMLAWAGMVSFNFFGAIGSVASQRNEHADKAEAKIDERGRLRERRDQINAQLKASLQARPPDQVAALMEGHKSHRFWRTTEGCTDKDMTAKGPTNYCKEFAALQAEHAAGLEKNKLSAELTRIDTQLDQPSMTHATKADPKGEAIAAYANMIGGRFGVSGVKAGHVRMAEPLLWFFVLETCSFAFGYGAIRAFGLSHHGVFDDLHAHTDARPPMPARLPPPRAQSQVAAAMAAADRAEAVQAIPLTSATTLATNDPGLQRAIFDRFWTRCVRPLPGGKEPLLSLYRAYTAFADSQHCNPYPYAEFGRLLPDAYRNGSEVNGVLWVMGLVLAEPMEAA